MCSPDIIARVRSSVDGAPRLNRRNAMKAAVAASAATAFAGHAAHGHQATPQATPVAGIRAAIVDLTHYLEPTSPVWPGNEPFAAEAVKTFEADGFYQQKVSFWEHTGTHVDAPIHFAEDGLEANALDIGTLFAPLAVIDISARAADDPDTSVTVDDILEYESVFGELPTGVLVAMNSGWSAKWDTPEEFVNQDAAGVQHYPGFHPDAAEFLVTERDIVGIAVDTLSQDPGNSTDFGTHITILGAGKYGIEGMNNLAAMDQAGASVYVGAPKWAGASGGPSRIIAFNRGR